MAKNKDDNRSKLDQMVQYIEQDGHEKAEEIDVLAEEEYFMEKKNYLDLRVGAVKKYFDNLENKFQQQILLDISKIKNQSYRDMLSARNLVVTDVFEAVRLRLIHLTSSQNTCLYKKVLYQLTTQGLLKMMEPSVVIEVKKKDVEMAKKVVKQAQDYFQKQTKMTVVVSVNENSFLSEKCPGGLMMYNKVRSMSLDNTLSSKLELVGFRMMPHVRKALFGVNPNRLHTD